MSPGNAPEEMNVYQNAEARFEEAAKKIGLEQGVYKYLKYPDKEVTMYIPVGNGQWDAGGFTGYRVLAFDGARAGQGRDSICAGRQPRRRYARWPRG